MKAKPSFLRAAAVALALAAAGALSGVNTAHALLPWPITPSGTVLVRGGISTTQLGQPFSDLLITEIERGERLGQTWVYSAPGFQVAEDGDITDDTVVGGVQVTADVYCDSVTKDDVDVFAKASSSPGN